MLKKLTLELCFNSILPHTSEWDQSEIYVPLTQNIYKMIIHAFKNLTVSKNAGIFFQKDLFYNFPS